MKKEWLKAQVTVEQAEADNIYNDVPFGTLNNDWNELKGRLGQDGQLWFFESPGEVWREGGGRKGYCVVRNEEITASLVTHAN